MEKLKTVFDKVPNFIWFGVLILGLLLVMRKMITKLFTFDFFGSSEQDIQNAQKGVDDVVVDNSKVYDKNKLDNVANSLYTMMDGLGTSGSDGDMYNILKDYNSEELKYIWKSFGLKEDKNLGQWFAGDLSDTNYIYWFQDTELTQMRKLWSKTGLTF